MSDRDAHPTVEERRQGAKAIEAALRQCGIGVRYLMSGPSELFDVASVLLKSEFMVAHDAEVERVTAEKCAQIADDYRTVTRVEADPPGLFGIAFWRSVGAEHVRNRIRSAFGLAPDEKGGE